MKKKDTLKSKISRKLKEAEDFLQKENLEEAKKNLQWIDLAENIFLLKKRKSNLISGIVVGISCAVLIGLSLLIKIPETSISFDVETNVVSFINSYNFKYQEPNNIQYFKIDKVDYLNIDLTKYKSETSFAVNVSGEKFHLSELNFPKESTLHFEKYINQLVIFINGNPITGILEMRNGKIEYNSHIIDKNNPDFLPNTRIEFISKNMDTNEVAMINMVSNDFNFKISDIKNIEFIDEIESNKGEKKSVILNGSIFINELDKKFHLVNGDSLIIKIKNGENIVVKEIENCLKVHFKGTVKKIGIKRQNRLYDLKPSLLEYLIKNERVAFIWGSLIFIWGVIWSIKKTIFN